LVFGLAFMAMASVVRQADWYIGAMVKMLEQAIAEVLRLPDEDQEQIGRSLLSHVEKLRALRTKVDKGLHSLDDGQGRESSIDEFIRQKNGSRRRPHGSRRGPADRSSP
jgi:hypothetical protein